MELIFNESIHCNLHLVRERYVNWEPKERSYEFFIRSQRVGLDSMFLNGEHIYCQIESSCTQGIPSNIPLCIDEKRSPCVVQNCVQLPSGGSRI
ncbi:hypothetical protein H5410_036947 [Solanum commersonii]|uniref:Uncharacterized protein n=1 Tax=Solanum commersonii TaxID=4109 RepID=A0A9J5Y4X3_SOLCO|nr:hypothetical protein H5410_036947 [Solanum commersonii]